MAENNPAPASAPAPAAPSTTTPAPAATPAPETKPPVTEPAAAPLEKKPDATAPGAKTEEPPKPAKETPKEVTKEDLKLPEGSLLDAKTVDEVVSFSKEKGLSKEAAQAVLERESKLLSSHVESEKAKVTQIQDSWTEASRTDKEIGGDDFTRNVELANRVFKRFGTEGFKQILDKTKAGNHPEVLRVFVRIGRAMSEDQLVMSDGMASGQRKDAAEVLFGSTSSKEKESK